MTTGIISVADAKKPTRPGPPPEPPTCIVEQPDYVVFLDDYPNGRFHLAVLPCLADDTVAQVSPQKLELDLPRRDRRKFQVGNGDIFYDGTVRRIVFGGRRGSSDHWGIYEGEVDIGRGMITGIRELVSTPLVREEDPRFSLDGQYIVYKRNGEIWRIFANNSAVEPELFHKEEGCELWAPSMFANVIAYVRRCGEDRQSDRIVYHPEGGKRTILTSEGGGPDRFSHFTKTGELVYSHLDAKENVASLWMYFANAGSIALYDETGSDDDSFAERGGSEYIAFSGWGTDAYDLYVYRRTPGNAVRLTSGINVFGSILFD
jgi:hypothetical protein